MKTYTLDDAQDGLIGPIGTPARDEFEKELEAEANNSPHAKSKSKVSDMRGEISPMTNEQIDQQFNDMRDEWQRD